MVDEREQAAVSGPISGGSRGYPFAKSSLDVAAYGYVEEELFVEGEATRFAPAPGAEHGPDGLWTAEPVERAPYRSRVLVYRPRDAAKFNGTAIVLWNNVTAGYELFGADSLEVLEGGYALACVSAQRVGIEGLPELNQGLRAWDPERYGTLSHPGDDYSFDIFTQVGRALGPRRATDGVDPLGGLPVRRLVGAGASQSAARLATYVNAIHPRERCFDGFILMIHFGGAVPLEVGEEVVNLAVGGGRASSRNRAKTRLRDDTGTPIFVVNSELEASACYEVRQPDTDTFRYWESAGTCHVSQQKHAARKLLARRDGIRSRRVPQGVNRIPVDPTYDAAYHHMQRWLAGEGPPPIQPRIEFAGDPPRPVRDEHGIAKGGIRLPQADVPLEVNDAIPLEQNVYAYLDGSSAPFSREKVLALYGDRASFAARFEAAARAAVDAGVIRPREIAPLTVEALETWDRLVG